MSLKSFITNYFWVSALLLITVWFGVGQLSTRGSEDGSRALTNPQASFGGPGTSVDSTGIASSLAVRNAGTHLPKFLDATVAQCTAGVPSVPTRTSVMFMGMAGLMMLMLRTGRALRQGRSMQMLR
jgi:hypothetical protein